MVISEDLEEILEISDQVSVLFAGRLSKPIPTAEASAERVGLLMAGVWKDEDAEAAHARQTRTRQH
jgi:simple sugar transport system ATP-binding protein